MVAGLALRVSWICLLLFSSVACFPATKGNYRYPYTVTGASGGGSDAGSNRPSGGSRLPLVNLQYGPSANHQQPAAAPQQASSPTGNQSTSSQAAPSVAAGSSPRYEPNKFIVTFDSSSNKPASVPAVPSPGVRPRPPTATGKRTPSVSVHSQSAAGTSGDSNMGSGGAASSPFYWASPFPAPGFPAPGYMAPTLDFGDGPVPYIGGPVTYYGAGSFPHANDYRHPNTATGGSGGGSAPGSNLQSEGSRSPMVNLQHKPSAPQQTRSPTGNKPPFSQGAPTAPAGPSQEAGDVSPTAHPLPPTDLGQETPKPQPTAGTSGNSNMGSGEAASSPVYWASFPAPGLPSTGAGYIVPTIDFGDGPVPYIGAPVTYNYGAGSSPHANSYPLTKGNYRYPYTATGGSGGGSAPGSNLQSEGLHPPRVNLQYRPSANHQQPEAAPQQASSPPAGPSQGAPAGPSQGAPAGPSQGAPAGPSQGAGDVHPSAHPLPPTDPGQETAKPQSAAGTSGNSNMASGGATSSPVYWASFPAPGLPSTGAGYMAPTLDFGDGPVPYIGAPVPSNYGAGSSPHASIYHPPKGGYRYPFTATGGSSGGSHLQSEVLLPPMVNLQYRPSANHLQTEATPQQASSPTGNQSPSSHGAPTAPEGPSQGAPTAPEGPSQGAPTAPEGPSQGAGDVSPSARPLPPKPQSAAGTSGNSNMGSGGAASSPVYWTSPTYPTAGNLATTYNYGAGSHANSYPSTKGQASSNTAATIGLGDGPVPYAGSTSFIFGAGSHPYAATPSSNSNDGPASDPGQPLVSQPAGEADTSSGPTDGSYPDADPAASNSSDGAGSDPGQPSVTQSAGGADTSSTDLTDGSYPDADPATSNSGDGTGSAPGQPLITQSAGGADMWSSDPTDGSYPDADPATSISGDGTDSAPGLPWFMQLTEGADYSFPDPSNWMPSYAFPDFSIWDSNSEMPESVGKTSPLPPSSYIIQSRNGYQRAREVLSHTKYSPEYPESPVLVYKAAKAPHKTLPLAGSKGGL